MFSGILLKEWSEANPSCIGPWTVQLNEASKIYVAINLTINCLHMVVMFSCSGCVIKGLYFSIIMYQKLTERQHQRKKKLVITITLATTGRLVGYTPYLWYFWAFALTGKDRTEDFLDVANFFFVQFKSNSYYLWISW